MRQAPQFSRSATVSASLFIAAIWVAGSLFAAVTVQQRQEINAIIKVEARKASVLFGKGKADEAAAVVDGAIGRIEALLGESPDDDLLRQVAPVVAQLREVHASLELDGVKVKALPAVEAPKGRPTRTPGGAAGGVSFSREVAPILVAKCGRCHVQDAKGKFSMATFAALARGTEDAGPVIMPGDGTGSRLVEVIESGDMPRGGAKVIAAELALLTKWIDQGAKYDGRNQAIPLAQLAATGGPAQPMPEPAGPTPIAKPSGKGTVSFAFDVAPILSAQCAGCHGANQPRANFSLATFERLMRGGDSGANVEPRKGADSLLVRKLKGQAGDRMPLDRPPLSAEQIAKIEKWIDEGAEYDGEDARLPLERVAAIARAARATPDELSKQRAEAAAGTWRLAIPDEEGTRVESEHFLVVGNLGEGVLRELSETTETQAKRVLTMLKAPAGLGIVKGRLTIFAFANRYDYSEFGTMVERREFPKTWLAHWQYDPVAPYVAVYIPSDGETNMASLVAQQLAALYVAELGKGKLPRWLAEGTGRAVASSMEPKDPRVTAWDDRVPEALALCAKPDHFMTGQPNAEDADVLSYSFVKLMRSNASRFNSLLADIRGGATAEEALQKAYRGTPSQLAESWATRAGRKR